MHGRSTREIMNRLLLICMLGTACVVPASRGTDALPEELERVLHDYETAW